MLRVFLSSLACGLLAMTPDALAQCEREQIARMGGNVDHIRVSGSIAVFDMGAKLEFVDSSSPTNPIRLGEIDVDLDHADLELDGSIAYLAAFNDGVCMVDFSDPTQPTIVGEITGFNAINLEIAWPYAYVMDGSDFANLKLRVYDIQDPANAQLLESLPVSFVRVRRFGARLYGLATSGDVTVLDLTNPALPVGVGAFDAGVSAQDIAVAGNLAYVAAGADGLRSFNVTNPAAVQPLGGYDNGTAYHVLLNGTRAYVADYQEIDILNISNPTAISPFGTFASDDDFTTRDIALNGFMLHVAGGTRYQIADTAIPSLPQPKGAMQSNGFIRDVATFGDWAYVGTETGVDILHLAAPGGPVKTNTITLPGDFTNVTVDLDRLYVARSGGLNIYGLTNPASPQFLGQFATTDPQRPTIVGTRAYLCGTNSLKIVNVANPASPTLLGEAPLGHTAYRCAVSGAYAYVTTSGYDVHVVNVGNPAAPFLVGTIPTASLDSGVAIYGGFLLVGEGSAGLSVFSLNNPAAPAFVVNHDLPGGLMTDIVVEGSFAYAADGANGVLIYDLTNTAAPALIDVLPVARYTHALAVAGNRVIASDDSCGILIFASGLASDLDGDGDVDIQNLATLLSNYGYTSGMLHEQGDINGDGGVDITDLAQMLSEFGATCP